MTTLKTIQMPRVTQRSRNCRSRNFCMGTEDISWLNAWRTVAGRQAGSGTLHLKILARHRLDAEHHVGLGLRALFTILAGAIGRRIVQVVSIILHDLLLGVGECRCHRCQRQSAEGKRCTTAYLSSDEGVVSSSTDAEHISMSI